MSGLAGRVRFGVGDAGGEFGAEPIVLRGGKGVLVADVRLDNRIELEAQMRIHPPVARSLSDARILAMAVERWGESAVDWVTGDYAFAWWDVGSGRLLLARDFAGTRALAFARRDDGVAFGGGTIERGEPVPAGHMLTIAAGSTAARRWWRPEPKGTGLVGEAEFAEGLNARLETAVRTRVRDVAEVAVVDGPGADAIAQAAAGQISAGNVRRVRSVAEAGQGVVLTGLLATQTIAYAGGNGGMLGLVPGSAKRVQARHRAAFEGLDLAAALAAPPGIEIRDPTADRRLVEFCLSVPPRLYARGLAKRAFG